MYIVIVGCGRLGSVIAMELSDAGHNMSVIDSNSKRLESLGSGFNGLSVKGIEYDSNVLKEAGISLGPGCLAFAPQKTQRFRKTVAAAGAGAQDPQ